MNFISSLDRKHDTGIKFYLWEEGLGKVLVNEIYIIEI